MERTIPCDASHDDGVVPIGSIVIASQDKGDTCIGTVDRVNVRSRTTGITSNRIRCRRSATIDSVINLISGE